VFWSDYSPNGRPRQSKDWRKDNNLGDEVDVKLAEKNEELVNLLSNTLKMILPHQYARGFEAGEMMRKKRSEPLFQA
jgi:hypothetical protein